MDDRDELDLVVMAFRLARSATGGYVTGYVEWCDDKAASIAREKLADLSGLTPEAIRCMSINFVSDGGKISQHEETRPDHLDYPFYYKIILKLEDFPRGVFVELRLVDDDRQNPVVHIVSAHRSGV